MGELEQIFGAALKQEERERTAPQGTAAVESPPVSETPESAKDVVIPVPMSRLASFVMDAFRTNRDHRRESGIDDKLEYALNANKCQFTDKQVGALANLVQSEDIAKKLHTPVTFVKTRGAKSLLGDLLSQGNEPLFDLSHSPMPELPDFVAAEAVRSVMAEVETIISGMQAQGLQQVPPEVLANLEELVRLATQEQYDTVFNQQETFARERAKRMRRKVWDIMEEGGFSDKVLPAAIDDLCVYGTCVVVGPIARAVEANRVHINKDGVAKYVREVTLKPVYECVSPWDCYPAPDAKETEDGPFCIKVKYAAHDLWRFCDAGVAREKNGEGWNAAVVREILERHPGGGVKLREFFDTSDAVRREGENKGYDDTRDCTFEGVRCFAFVRGSMLSEMGIVKSRRGKPIRVNDYYRVEAIVVDGKVVFCRILDDRMGIPVSKATFYQTPGSWWGESIADKLKLVQMMQNNTAKSLFLDLAGTGSMFWVRNAGALVDKSGNATTWRPYGSILFNDSVYAPGGSALPMGTVDIPSKARELVLEWDMWMQQADNDSGIPRFAEGQSAGQSGALRTASGLAQFNEHMMRGMKMVLTAFDEGLIRTIVRRTADWELIYGDDMNLKGDVYVRPIGLIGRIMRVQRDQARMQLFNMIVSNQFLIQCIGPKGILALLRPSLQDIDVNPDDILPGVERMKFLEKVEELKQKIAAQNPQGVEGDAQAQAQGGPQGAPPGVAQPPQVMPQGGVEERRSVA